MFARLIVAAALLLWVSTLTSFVLDARMPAVDNARSVSPWSPPRPGAPRRDVSADADAEPDAPPAHPDAAQPDAAPPGDPSPRAGVSLKGLPFRSVTMQLQRPDWIDRYEQSVDEIAALGADTVMFVVDPRQEHGESCRIYLDLRMTPGTADLQRLIRHAKDKKLRVILMPIVLLDAPRKDTEWRGTIKPTYEGKDGWAQWWQSYTDMMTHYAWISESSGVDLLVVGSELVSTESQVDRWRKLITHVRGIYKGKITYSSNWDHYSSVKVWDRLDLIGMNSYWSLDEGKKEKAGVEDIRAAWKAIQEDLLPFARKQGKPIMFLEAGWCSIANAASEPWDYTQTSEPLDLELQKRLYQGFFESWYGNPQLGGFSVWEWPPGDGGPADRGYTPKGKPAEQVLREYVGKPAWEVKAK